MTADLNAWERLDDARGRLNALSINLYGLFGMLAHGEYPNSETFVDLNISYTDDLEQIISVITDICRDYNLVRTETES